MKNFKYVKIIAFLILLTNFHTGFANTTEKTENCLRCHSMETLAYRDKNTGEVINLYVNAQQYKQSNHKNLECTTCHAAEHNEYPHPASVKQEQLYCLDCHKEDSKFIPYRFTEIEQDFNHSVHVTESPYKFSCFSCHNPHQFKISQVGEDLSKIIGYDNGICLNCHTATGQSKSSATLLKSHQWLPNPSLHWKHVRCVECHTPAGEHFSHKILPSEKSVKNCVECHSKEATLLTRLYKYRSQEDLQETGWLNQAVFNRAYIVGMSRNETIDLWSLIILGFTILGLLAHGLGRFLTNKIRSNKK